MIVQSEDEAAIREQVEGYKQMARDEFGREVRIWTHTVVVQRQSQAEADAYLQRFSVEYEDTESVDAWLRLQGANSQMVPLEIIEAMRQRFAAGAGAFPLVGTAEAIAERLEMLSRAGIDGALLTWVDYDAGIADFTREVLPYLEKAGLREPVERSASFHSGSRSPNLQQPAGAPSTT